MVGKIIVMVVNQRKKCGFKIVFYACQGWLNWVKQHGGINEVKDIGTVTNNIGGEKILLLTSNINPF